MRQNRILILTVVLTLAALPFVSGVAQSSSGPISIDAKVEPNRGYVGDRLAYSVTIDADTTVKFSGLPTGDKLGVFEIKSSSTQTVPEKGSRAKTIYMYEIAAFETGDFWIPAQTVQIVLPDGGTTEASTDSVHVVVMSIAGRDSLADIRGLKKPIAFGRQIPWTMVGIGAVLLAIIIYVLYTVFRKKHQEEEAAEPVDTRPAWIIAQERLQKLRESDLVTRGEFKLFYQSLTDIIRRYLEPRYGIDAIDRTTFELRRMLKNIGMDVDNFDLLFGMFDSADLVKFAKRIPTREELEADFQKAWQFVQRTSTAQSAAQSTEVVAG